MSTTITHFSFSSAGGAGNVAQRLTAAQRNLGWDARLVTASTRDLRSSPTEYPLHTLAAAVDEFVVKKPDFDSLFSLYRDRQVALRNNPHGSDIVHLHWVNGLNDLEKTFALHKEQVVWTLHDMNPFSGGCHYTLGCEGFTSDCSDCPAVRAPFHDSVRRNLDKKILLYQKWPRLKMVAPSQWIAEQASRSRALRNIDISVIPNPLDPLFFEGPLSLDAELPSDRTRLAVVAAQLDSPVKGVAWAVEAFSAAYEKNPALQLFLLGDGGQKYRGMPGVRLVGPVKTPELIRILDTIDALVIPSLADNSPSVAYEAASRGVIPIVRNAGGLPEIVSRLGDGFVVSSHSDLIGLLGKTTTKLLSTDERRAALSRAAKKSAEPSGVALRYIELYENMIERTSPE